MSLKNYFFKKHDGSVLDSKEATERSQPSGSQWSQAAPHPGSQYRIAVKGVLENLEYGLGVRRYQWIVNVLRCANHHVLIRELSFSVGSACYSTMGHEVCNFFSNDSTEETKKVHTHTKKYGKTMICLHDGWLLYRSLDYFCVLKYFIIKSCRKQ